MSSEGKINKDINDYIGMFNSVCKQIGSHLVAQVPKNKNIHIYNDAVCGIIKNKPSEIISVFIMICIVFRKRG